MANLLADAYHAGTKAAFDTKLGQIFPGAHGAATSAGYPWSGVEREVFVKGYVDVIQALWPQGILVDAEGKLIEAPNPTARTRKAGPDAITALKAILDTAQELLSLDEKHQETIEWIIELAKAAIRKEEG